MKKKKRIKTLQLNYAGLMAEMVSLCDKYEILSSVLKQSSIEHKLAAPAKIVRYKLKAPEDVFKLYSELFGFAIWESETAPEGIIFSAKDCKLKSISKILNSAKPCELCCINPLKSLCDALKNNYNIEVKKTLWEDDQCIFYLTPKTNQKQII
ncbi:MAG: hypothetical protein ACM34K_07790 [Bacillota bacterium]